MNKVMVNGKTYKVIEDASDDIDTTMVDGNTIEYVSGVCEDDKHNRYEVDWFINANTDDLPEDASGWVNDWDTADEVHLVED